jgi:ribose transport system ATP-binding protein
MLERLLAQNDLVLAALLATCVAAFGAVDPGFVSAGNLFSILQQTSVIAVVAFGMTALIIARGIDISVGSTLALAGIVGARSFVATGSVPLALAATMLTGGAMGALNGLLVGVIGISPFIATLASMAFARGLALSLSHASSIAIADPALLWAGSATLFRLPASILIAAVLLLAWWGVLGSTVFGRWIHAVGGNRGAAHASLVPVRRVEWLAYGLVGLSAGLGAIMTFGRLGSAQPLAGIGLEFTAITAAIIGGTKLSGGEGSVLGTALGALLLGVINTGLSFLEVPQQHIYLITGGLIVVAVLVSQPSILGRGWRDARAAFAAGATRPPARTAGPRRLEVRGIGKTFPGVRALDGVSFALRSGDVVGLAGENGAGKSTLVKCLSGLHRADEGQILVDGREVKPGSGGDVTGISVIHQHFSLAPHLSVTESLFLGREPRGALGLLDRRGMAARARAVLSELGLAVDPDAAVGTLTVGQKQMVEIARAVLADAWLFIMDEPTSALSNRERDHLYEIIRRLLGRGAGILYISHKLEELFTLTNRMIVLRDGRFVGERVTRATTESQLIGMMVGRELGGLFPFQECALGETVLIVQGLADGGLLRDASLTVRAGEIVALTGLMGSGRSEVLRAIAGLGRFTAGQVFVAGRSLRSGDLAAAHAAGVVLVPEDRHAEGFVGPLSVRDNLSLVWIRRHSPFGLISRPRVTALARDLIARLAVRPAQPGKRTLELSGGNQQKVVIGKWLATGPRVLLLDEPTRGVDVAAKADLHRLIAGYKSRGAAILMVSSELPEVLGVADRIVVMHDGRVAGELPRGADEATVTELAFGRPRISGPSRAAGTMQEA